MDDIDSSKLVLQGNVKIKVTYNDQSVAVKTKKDDFTFNIYDRYMVLHTKDQTFLNKIRNFEVHVLDKIIENKQLFFEKQRKVKASDEDIRQLWSWSVDVNAGTFRFFYDTWDETIFEKTGDTASVCKIQLQAICGHVWISKTKAGIIWNIATIV